MADNAIIQAAGAAYGPMKGEYDISGFVQGFTNIAKGLIAQEQRFTKGKALLDKRGNLVKTKYGEYRGHLDQIKKQYLVDRDLDKATAAVDNIIMGTNSVNALGKLADEMYEGGSYSADVPPLYKNYLNALRTGDLSTPIKYGDKKLDPFFGFDADNNPQVLGPDGQYTSVDNLYAILSSYAKKSDGDDLVKSVNSFTSSTYANEEAWENAAGSLQTTLNSGFKNEKARNAFLLDNQQNIGLNKSENFVDYYLDNKLFGNLEYKNKAKFDEVMNSETSTAKEKRATRELMVSTLMKIDKNIETDIDDFITGIINAKKPKAKVNGQIPLIPVGKDGRLTTAGSKIKEIDNLFRNPASYKMSFGGDKKMYIKLTGGKPGEATLMLESGDAALSLGDTPITFDLTSTEGLRKGIKIAGDRLMTWAEKADFDYYLNNVNLASFVAGSDRDGTINSPYVLFSDNKNEIRGTIEGAEGMYFEDLAGTVYLYENEDFKVVRGIGLRERMNTKYNSNK